VPRLRKHWLTKQRKVRFPDGLCVCLNDPPTLKSQAMQIKQPAARIDSVDSLASSTTAASTAPDSDSPSITLSADPDAKQVLISITPPDKPQGKQAKDSGKRPPLDICCVIDVSGSMGTEAPIPADPTTGAPAESTGLSVLDVVKHALKTIIATMQEGEHLCP
jgi:hypothetical protein